MSRATATPPAGRPSAPAAVQPAVPSTAGPTTRTGSIVSTATTGRAVGPTHRLSGQVRAALEGTPGRMRLLGFVAALAAAVFGIVGAMSLWSAAGALDRADHNTAQVVRVQDIYANLVRADADATNAFLVGGIENTDQRADYDASLARVATGIAKAAEAQPADLTALGTLNTQVQRYAATVEQARAYNRQGLPVGAQYLSQASASLRSDTLPIVDALRTANTNRANVEFDASSSRPALFLVGIAALIVLLAVMVWLARRTHRYLNVSIGLGALLLLLAMAVGAVVLGLVGSQVSSVRSTDYAYTTAVAGARTAAFDAKANESLTLIARGSGSAYETAWTSQSTAVTNALRGLPRERQQQLSFDWNAYTALHTKIREADQAGQWDQAVTAATQTGAGSANAAFATFDAGSATALDSFAAQTSASLTAPVAWVTIVGWAFLAICVAAALLVLRGISERVEEYR